MLLEEGVVHQLLDVGTVVRVLPQTLVQEIAHLHAHRQVGGDLDLVLYDLDELLLAGDLEGVLREICTAVHSYGDVAVGKQGDMNV